MDLVTLYQDLHQNPELSFAEHRTAGLVATHLRELGLDVTEGVGRTGVVGVLRNGDGPTVLLRADFDALPVAEQTGLPYASTVTVTGPDGNEVPVMHACGHDMHTTCLLGAVAELADTRDAWSGTVLAVFQPAEEIGEGAQAMVDDGFFDRFGRPDVVLGQHVIPAPPGHILYAPGTTLAAADSLRVTLHGKGGHGSQPESTVDPVVLAAATILRLQTVVSRETSAGDPAVLTVGSVRAGTKANIIPDRAELLLNIRTFAEPVRARVLAAVERIVAAEATASGAPREPEIQLYDRFAVTVNDPDATARTVEALTAAFGADHVHEFGPLPASEDVGVFATASGAPMCYWFLGCTDNPATNHSPHFAPQIDPTLTVGVRTLTTAARAWLT